MNKEFNAVVEQEKPLDLRLLFFIYILRPWYLYVIGFALAGLVASFYLRYTTPIYLAKAQLLIKSPESGGQDLTQAFLLNDIADLNGTNIENELLVLKSRTLMRNVVDKLQLNIRYEIEGRVRTSETYLDSPILLDSFVIDTANQLRQIQIEEQNDGQLSLGTVKEKLGTAKYGVWFHSKFGDFLFKKGKDNVSDEGKILISFLDPTPQD